MTEMSIRILALILMCLPLPAAVATVATTQSDEIVARVFGESVLLSEVRYLHSDAQWQFRVRNGRDPSGAEDEKTVKSIAHEIEIRQCALQIRNIVIKHQLLTRAIDVTDEEVSIEWEKQWKESIGATLKQIAPFQRKLLDALSEVYDKKQNPDDVYRRRLATEGQKGAWDSAVVMMRDPKMRHDMAAELESKESAFTVRKEHIKQVLKYKKLDVQIDRELAKNDPKYRSALSNLEKAATPLMQSKVDMDYIKVGHEGWWIERIQKAHPKVLLPEFDEALRIPGITQSRELR